MPGLVPYTEQVGTTVLLSDAFKKYVDRKPLPGRASPPNEPTNDFIWPGDDPPWVWDDRPATIARRIKSAMARDDLLKKGPVRRREEEALQEFRLALESGGLVGLVREHRTGSFWALSKDGWAEARFRPLMFYGEAIDNASAWYRDELDGAYPVLDAARFEKWLERPRTKSTPRRYALADVQTAIEHLVELWRVDKCRRYGRQELYTILSADSGCFPVISTTDFRAAWKGARLPRSWRKLGRISKAEASKPDVASSLIWPPEKS